MKLIRNLRSGLLNWTVAFLVATSMSMPQALAATQADAMRLLGSAVGRDAQGLSQADYLRKDEILQAHGQETSGTELDLLSVLPQSSLELGGEIIIDQSVLQEDPFILFAYYWAYLVPRATQLGVTVKKAVKDPRTKRLVFKGSFFGEDWSLPTAIANLNSEFGMRLEADWLIESRPAELAAQFPEMANGEMGSPFFEQSVQFLRGISTARYRNIRSALRKYGAVTPSAEEMREHFEEVGAEALGEAANYLKELGLSVTSLKVAVVNEGKLAEKLDKKKAEDAISSPAAQVSVGTTTLQVFAAANYPGLADTEGLSAEEAKAFFEEFGKIADSAAVAAGSAALKALAKKYNIKIIIAGNEGPGRDGSAGLSVGKVFNSEGTNGTFLYFGDSIEVTEGIKHAHNRSGAMIALVPANLHGMPDGYLASVFADLPNDGGFDPVRALSGHFDEEIEKLANDNGFDSVEAFAKEYDIMDLNRERHELMLKQAEARGFGIVTELDGDPIPSLLRAINGIRGANGKKLVVLGISGANEAYMTVMAAALQNKGVARSRVVSREVVESLKKVKGAVGPELMETIIKFTEEDMKEVEKVNKALEKRNAEVDGADIPRLDVNETITRASVRALLDKRDEKAAYAFASITGAGEADAGVLKELLRPVNFNHETNEATATGYFVNSDGQLVFYEIVLKSEDLLESRWDSLTLKSDGDSVEGLVKNPKIEKFLEAQSAYLSAKEDVKAVEAYYHFLASQLGLAANERITSEILDDYNEAIGQLEPRVKAQILGVPYIIDEKGERLNLATPISDETTHAAEAPSTSIALTTDAEGEGVKVTKSSGITGALVLFADPKDIPETLPNDAAFEALQIDDAPQNGFAKMIKAARAAAAGA